MRNKIIALAATALIAAAGHAAMKGAALAPQAKISLVQARTAALQARAGKITDEELETEKGGSGLRYSFDILSKGKTYEVGIDAKTGALLENGVEGQHSD